MYTGWNLVISLVLIALCGQSLGFWPFDVLAAKDGPDTVYENSKAKRIAIIGMNFFFLEFSSSAFRI